MTRLGLIGTLVAMIASGCLGGCSGKAPEERPEAAAEFRAWAEALAIRCDSVRHVCTAHARLASLSSEPAGTVGARVREALAREEKVLRAHEGRA